MPQSLYEDDGDERKASGGPANKLAVCASLSSNSRRGGGGRLTLGVGGGAALGAGGRHGLAGGDGGGCANSWRRAADGAGRQAVGSAAAAEQLWEAGALTPHCGAGSVSYARIRMKKK
jgi:hypothetical protein